eukprot:641505_1
MSQLCKEIIGFIYWDCSHSTRDLFIDQTRCHHFLNMSSLDTYSHYVTISYIAIYGSIFLFAAMYSAYDVYTTHSRHKGTKATSPDPTPHNEGSEPEASPLNDEKESAQDSQTGTIAIDCGDSKDASTDASKQKCCGIGCINFLKMFYKSLAAKKSVYLSLIPHLFDQGTDFGVIWQYYVLWQTSQRNAHINYEAFFYCSIAVIIVHKLISCSVVYTLTQSICDVVLQIFDLMMVKAIYASYKSPTNDPGNSQKLLQILEGTIESAPQIFISLVFLIKSDRFDWIVFISLLISFWTLTSRVIAEDKGTVDRRFKEPEWNFKHMCEAPIVNKNYLLRVLFRYTEIMNRITLFALFWVSLGGVAVGMILGMELLWVLFISVRSKEMMIVANLIYFFQFQIGSPLYGLFLLYKFILSPYIYMILITSSVYNEEHNNIHHLVLETPLGLVSFVYCWATCVLLSCFLCCSDAIDVSGGSLCRMCSYMQERESEITRDVKTLSQQGKYLDVLNLISFGIPKKKLLFRDDGTILHLLFRSRYIPDISVFTAFCEIVFELDPHLWKVKDEKGRLCTFHCGSGSDGWEMIRHLVEKYDANESELVSYLQTDSVCGIIEREGVNRTPWLIYMTGPYGTIMHHVFAHKYWHTDRYGYGDKYSAIFKEIAEKIEEKQLWKESDQYGLLCGDVAFDGAAVIKYIPHLVDKYKMDPTDLFSDATAFSLFVKYGVHAKEIIALCNITYDESNTERQLKSLSLAIKRHFEKRIDFLKKNQKEDEDEKENEFSSFAWARSNLKEKVLQILSGRERFQERSMTVGMSRVVGQLIEADRTWLRFIGDRHSNVEGFNLVQAAQTDLEKKK